MTHNFFLLLAFNHFRIVTKIVAKQLYSKTISIIYDIGLQCNIRENIFRCLKAHEKWKTNSYSMSSTFLLNVECVFHCFFWLAFFTPKKYETFFILINYCLVSVPCYQDIYIYIVHRNCECCQGFQCTLEYGILQSFLDDKVTLPTLVKFQRLPVYRWFIFH